MNAALVERQATAAIADLQVSLGELAPAVKAATETLANTAKLTGDPAIAGSLAHLDAATGDLAIVTQNLAGISKDGKDVADKVRNDYLKPQKFAWELVKQLAGLGGSLAQMVK